MDPVLGDARRGLEVVAKPKGVSHFVHGHLLDTLQDQLVELRLAGLLALLGCHLNHPFHVDRVRIASVDQAARRVGQDVDSRVSKRADDSVGNLLAGLVLSVMDAGDDPIRFGQDVVRPARLWADDPN